MTSCEEEGEINYQSFFVNQPFSTQVGRQKRGPQDQERSEKKRLILDQELEKKKLNNESQVYDIF